MTLERAGRLRGCVGRIVPGPPLASVVEEMAVAAAFNDGRFEPVKAEEVSALEISISVLSLLAPVDPARALDVLAVGVHGLVVTRGSRRGLLLPQVAVEQGWTLDVFLEQTCRKAGLEPGAWKTGATLECFSAEILTEGPPEGEG